MHNISAIAAFIGARLSHELPACNGMGRSSTIRVRQYKEKFGRIRIYVEFADPELVGNDSVKQCFKLDCIHYRTCYLDMVKLVPKCRSEIANEADYYELLIETKDEFDIYFADHVAKFPDFFLQRYARAGVTDIKSLYAFICNVCYPENRVSG